MYNYKSLEDIDLKIIYQTFIEAFSDYEVKLELSFSKFKNMMKRRGLILELSIGAFDKGRLVGFILNGVRIYKGKKTIYDLGTGVIPHYRREGIIEESFKKVCKLCQENKVESYLLEVLQNNIGAVELYKKQGFKIIREFECYLLENSKYLKEREIEIIKVDYLSEDNWKEIKEFWNYEPSWQNSIDSIQSCPDNFSYFIVKKEDKIVGYGILEKDTGDIPQLAVKIEARREGIGSSILKELQKDSKKEVLKILNIDKRDSEFINFLKENGYKNFTNQYEMILDL